MVNEGDYLPIEHFDIIASYEDQDPWYAAVYEGRRIPICPVFSCLVPGAIGIELRREEVPGLYSKDPKNPYVWVPVHYGRGNKENGKFDQ